MNQATLMGGGPIGAARRDVYTARPPTFPNEPGRRLYCTRWMLAQSGEENLSLSPLRHGDRDSERGRMLPLLGGCFGTPGRLWRILWRILNCMQARHWCISWR